MKKLLLSISFLMAMSSGQAQNLVTENFDVLPATWTKLNVSSPLGANAWATPVAGNLPYFDGGTGAYNGDPTSFAFVNFNSTTGGAGTISNWFITPVMSLMNGDVISFYAIKGLSGGADVYADRMQVRLSTAGAGSTAPVGATGLGSYTTVMHDINPALDGTSFPTTWTEYTYTVTGLSGPTDCRVGFRYFVTGAGPTGANSDQIGIDQFSVDRPLSTGDFFSQNFALYPNPVKTTFNLTSKNGATVDNVKVIDINGRIVSDSNFTGLDNVDINVANLTSGVYFVKIQSEQGVGTTKIIKD